MPPTGWRAVHPTASLRPMIQDVDAALEALVRRDALNGSRVEVLFDAPTKEWVARRNSPTIDLYLYDIREELNRREVVWGDVRDEAGRVVERRPPARRFRLSYLVTAWTQRPEDEHRLLSSLLSAFVATETLPADLLGGVLKDAPVPVILRVALPPSEDRSIADVWTAMGGELKPSLDIQIIAPVDVHRGLAAAKPVLEGPSLRVRRGDGATEDSDGVAAAAGGTGSAGGSGSQAGIAGLGGSARFRRSSRLLSPSDPAFQDETVASGEAGLGALETRTGRAGKAAAPGKAGADDRARLPRPVTAEDPPTKLRRVEADASTCAASRAPDPWRTTPRPRCAGRHLRRWHISGAASRLSRAVSSASSSDGGARTRIRTTGSGAVHLRCAGGPAPGGTRRVVGHR